MPAAQSSTVFNNVGSFLTHLIFPKEISKVHPWKLVEEIMDSKHKILEGDYQGVSFKVADFSGSCMLRMIFSKVIS